MMRALILLVVLAGCTHTHPLVEHEHSHEHDHHHTHQHDHTHESKEAALHKELVGKYRLEEYDDGYNRDEVRGELTIGLNHMFAISVEHFIPTDNRIPVRSFFNGDVRYYSIVPNKPLFLIFDSEAKWVYHQINGWNSEYSLRYKWDGVMLTLILYDLGDSRLVDNVKVIMTWRKVD